MSLSRGVSLFRKLDGTLRKPIAGHMIQQTRNSGGLYSYRCGAYPITKMQKIGPNILTGLMWWWIFWHFYKEPDHVFGEFPYPDPSKWTDEELGIPPDDAA